MWHKEIKFPTSRGEFLISPAAAEPKSDVHSPTTRISLHGHEYVPSEDHAILALGSMWGFESIRFTLLPISASRTEVTAECVLPLMVPYYQELLEKIADLYPETPKFLSFPETNPTQSTAASSQQTIIFHGDNVRGDKVAGNKITSASISPSDDRENAQGAPV